MPLANLSALAAVALWASLASLGLALAHVPPFFLTGVALMIGGALALPAAVMQPACWKLPLPALALGVCTLFGFHFLLFIALRLAPAVEVNLVNYLWPLFIVVGAPLYLRGLHWRAHHLVAALLGFAGAVLAMLGAAGGGAGPGVTAAGTGTWVGYAMALASALIWANYSLQTRRLAQAGRGFQTAAIGLFGLVSGALSLLCHWALEPTVTLSSRDAWLLLATGLGPLGAAFYLWDRALKLGDARHVGLLSYFTPLASTALLLVVAGRDWNWSVVIAAGLIVSAALLGLRKG
jgi:drug/metabolite transporter (DMT)-like permease